MPLLITAAAMVVGMVMAAAVVKKAADMVGGMTSTMLPKAHLALEYES